MHISELKITNFRKFGIGPNGEPGLTMPRTTSFGSSERTFRLESWIVHSIWCSSEMARYEEVTPEHLRFVKERSAQLYLFNL